ncbi:hypothetical protein IQ06DRAFT_204093, partial [Phaeosphaeriaceae sp. SRC1lsM3a]
HELPLEIIQQIFGYLSPLDFNAARHSCRTWMRASLDVNIIKVMLIRGGWSNDTKTTCAATESQAWPYSRYLSRQCALMAGWTGNGFDHTAAIAEASNIDLTELSNGYDVSNGEQYGGLLYSISNCGDFVLIARDTLVEVYGLWAGTLLLVNRLVCPRRVLCMSMDASSGCHAVALLLEGRMGQVCELHHDSDDEGCPAVHAYESEAFNTVHVQSDCHTIRLRGNVDMRCHPQSQNCPNTSCRRIAIIDRGVSTFYRHLCSEDDPPRSIAQDPQHKCVAFGCSASIELHWKDALSGQSLSRWFPLTAPSDYLSFLPPRPRLESNKRLRLISSTAHPGDRPTIRRKFFPSQPTSGFYCGDYDSGSTARHACDHYHAMPLSDGLHVLFVDSREDMLVFGCDAPVGGPTKLLRKVFLIPPKQDSVPLLFTAAVDLEHGARIVAVYGETIMLYSIASDIIVDSQKEQENISAAQTAVFAHNRTRDHWSNWW